MMIMVMMIILVCVCFHNPDCFMSVVFHVSEEVKKICSVHFGNIFFVD